MGNERTEKEDNDIYDDREREEQMEEDAIEPEEAGFMEGYESPNMVKCCECKKLCDLEHAIELEIDGETKWFCSKECAEKYGEEHSQETE